MSNTIPAAVRALLEELSCDTTQDRAEKIGAILTQYPEEKPAPVITAETPACYSNDAIREHAEHLARNEVYYCVSSLVSTLARSYEAGEAVGLDEDEVYSLCSQQDWETPAREWIDRADMDEMRDAYEYAAIGHSWPELDEDADEEKVRTELVELLEHTEEWQEFCDYVKEDPHTHEAYEHWIVSSWLAARLEEQGEIVARDFLGLTIWGRCTTGQSMSMDSVMLTIARDALAR